MSYDNSNQTEISLWEKTAKSGKTYYFGMSDTQKFTLFPNNSQNPKAPAYKLLAAPREDAPQESRQEKAARSADDLF